MPYDHLATASAASLEARYGEPQAPALTWNDVIEGLLAHRSVRAYLPNSLPDGIEGVLLAAAQSAATSSNMQMWSVVAVRDPARRARLAVLAGNQKHIAEAPLFLVWLADLSRAERIGAAKGQAMVALPFTETFMVGLIDAALAAQNAVVAAESLGLGTVYIGSMRNDPVRVSVELGLPSQVMAVFGLCVGVPDPARPTSVKPRLPASVVLHRERYDATAEASGLAAYDRQLLRFQQQEGMADRGWTGRVMERLGSVRGIGGREHMRAWLKTLGFPLD